MNRRKFLSSVAAGGAALSIPIPAEGYRESRSKPQQERMAAGGPVRSFQTDSNRPLIKIGRRSLEELRDHFRKEVDVDTIAYWEKYGVDREYGGYLKANKTDGTYPTTDKDLYSQGRILWIYSYLYNNFGKKSLHFEAARQGKEALTKHCRAEGGHWGTLYTMDWKQKQGWFDIYADIYMILGLAEYYKASGDEEALRLAVDTSYVANKMILAPHYQGQGHGPSYEPGIKRIGTWVHFLFPLTLLLTYAKDDGLEMVARICVRNILRHHWDREKGFAWEFLDNQYRPFSNDYLSAFRDDTSGGMGLISGWHNIQGAFKVMLEAQRLSSPEMFLEAMDFGLQVVKAHFREGEGCAFLDFYGEENFRKGMGVPNKAFYALYDFFVFLLLAIEHAHHSQAVEMFERVFSYAQSQPGGIYNGSLTLHEPRGAMFCFQILERMIQRGGKTSGLLSVGH